MHYLMIYHLFGLLWTSQFIQAAAYATIAGAFCEYYWTLDKRQVPARPVLRSVWRTIRYHFGSVAFGSLIIAIVQFLRIALEYVDQKMRAAKQGNAVVKVAMMCFKCFLWCFEKCLKFLNKNAFIVMAMKGRSFCPSMKDSFSLLLANAARVATVSIIARFLMILGKIFITGFCMLFMFVFIRYPPTHLPSFFMGDLASVSSPIFPMLLTGVLSYATASFFLDVYGTGIDTILLCFLRRLLRQQDLRAVLYERRAGRLHRGACKAQRLQRLSAQSLQHARQRSRPSPGNSSAHLQRAYGPHDQGQMNRAQRYTAEVDNSIVATIRVCIYLSVPPYLCIPCTLVILHA